MLKFCYLPILPNIKILLFKFNTTFKKSFKLAKLTVAGYFTSQELVFSFRPGPSNIIL